jgi:hypothetical protein
VTPRTSATAHAQALEQVRLHLGDAVDAPPGVGDRPAPLTVAVHEFEVAVATPRLRLLRLVMNVYSRPLPNGSQVRLLIGNGRIAPLPDPEAREPGDIRVGFPVPVELLDDTTYAVDLGDGRIVNLPRPVDRADAGVSRGRRFTR